MKIDTRGYACDIPAHEHTYFVSMKAFYRPTTSFGQFDSEHGLLKYIKARHEATTRHTRNLRPMEFVRWSRTRCVQRSELISMPSSERWLARLSCSSDSTSHVVSRNYWTQAEHLMELEKPQQPQQPQQQQPQQQRLDRRPFRQEDLSMGCWFTVRVLCVRKKPLCPVTHCAKRMLSSPGKAAEDEERVPTDTVDAVPSAADRKSNTVLLYKLAMDLRLPFVTSNFDRVSADRYGALYPRHSSHQT